MKCKKCKIKMIYNRIEWADDEHGNCGELVYEKCPKCKEEKLNPRKGENYSYAYIHD